MVIPTHNQCRFLSFAIESALAQTLQPVEVVVVDSGSTDATPEVLEKYASRITAVRESNIGPSAARNRGVAVAKGEFVVFVDGDDLLATDCAEARVGLLETNPASEVVVGALRIVDAEGSPIRNEGLGEATGAPLDHDTMLATMYGPTCGLTVRRSAYEALGGFDESMMIAEDSDFVIRAAMRAPLRYDAEPRADYRQAGASLSRRWTLWYDSYRRMIEKHRMLTSDEARFGSIVTPKFRDMICNMMFAKPLKDAGLAALPSVLRTLILRPSLIPFIGYWFGRMVRNRLRRTAQTPTQI